MKVNKASDFFFHLGLLLTFNVVGVAVILLAFPTTFTTFNCQRLNSNQGKCELKTIGGPFNKEQVRSFPVKELKSASLESYSYSSKKINYYTRLKTERGEISLPTGFYGPSWNTASLPTEINDFIKNPNRTSFSAQENDNRWQSYLFLGLFLGMVDLIIINSIIIRMKASQSEA